MQTELFGLSEDQLVVPSRFFQRLEKKSVVDQMKIGGVSEFHLDLLFQFGIDRSMVEAEFLLKELSRRFERFPRPLSKSAERSSEVQSGSKCRG